MPVTAKLSKKFYDALGEEVANELVEWFNQVDAPYRADLRELNELNFARFDARLEQRFAQYDAKLAERFARYDVKLENGLTSVASTFERKLTELRFEMSRELARVDSRFETLEERFNGALANQKTELVRWMVGFWLATVIPIVGLLISNMG